MATIFSRRLAKNVNCGFMDMQQLTIAACAYLLGACMQHLQEHLFLAKRVFGAADFTTWSLRIGAEPFLTDTIRLSELPLCTGTLAA